jgi:mRNA interferase RelE/StbE
MSYRVEFTPRARKEFDSQEHVIQGRILRALSRLAADPYQSPNVKALGGGGYRLRVGDFRVLSIVENERLLVLVVGVRDRREAYRSRARISEGL